MSIMGIPINYRKETQLYFAERFEDDIEYEEIKSGAYFDYFAKLDYLNHFVKALNRLPKISEENIIVSDKIEISNDLRKKLYWKLESIVGSFNNDDKENLQHWIIKGSFPRCDSKDTLYRICLGLGATVEQTAEFFLKGCFLQPFDPKDQHDVVYFFCIRDGKTIKDAERLIQSSTPACTKRSATLGLYSRMLENLNDEDSLITYIHDYCYCDKGDKREYLLAREKIKDLTEELKKQGIEFKFRDSSNEELLDKNNKSTYNNIFEAKVKKLLKDIYRDAQIEGAIKALKYIKETFPVYYTDNGIAKYKGDQSELIRRTLMSRYLMCYRENMVSKTTFGDFRDNLDVILETCGFMQIYPRNPFDCFVLICAYHYSNNPEDGDPLSDIINHLFFDTLDVKIEDDKKKSNT